MTGWLGLPTPHDVLAAAGAARARFTMKYSSMLANLALKCSLEKKKRVIRHLIVVLTMLYLEMNSL